jgi:flagellar biosynthesis chaperone FliJ
MSTPDPVSNPRDELESLDRQIAELQRNADELRANLAEDSDKTGAIEAADEQQALISSLDVRRRELLAVLERR